MLQKPGAYSGQIWQRFKKNKLALAALIVIAVATFCAIFAYWIVPDNSPNADFQTVEIQAKKPGYRQTFLQIPNGNSNVDNPFHVLLFGKKQSYQLIPINSYQIAGDSLVVQKYVDEDTTIMQSYFIPSILKKNKNISSNIIAKKYRLGTDTYGRDILSRIILGTRVSLGVGFIAVIISLGIGILFGAVAGYFGGHTDKLLMWFLNVTWSIPTLLLVFAITIAMGKGFWQIFTAVGLTMWVNVARLVRGQVMVLKEMEYVQAAKVLGFSHARIIVKHILPNIMGPLMVMAAANFATAIIIEAGLSFLGLGIQPPHPSWGLMIKENYNFVITNNPMLALAPGIAIMLMVLAFNLLGNALSDAMDVKSL
ncbi:MAG: ABC transporter permease [Chitinophagaceae bacterium]|nr:ABC transporter permease [Chitinophagaceae bacterium]